VTENLGRPPLSVLVAKQIEKMVRNGALSPGERIPPEKELAERYGVGRSSIREALEAMEHIGMIETQQGVGRFLSRNALSLLDGLTWGRMIQNAPSLALMEARAIVEVGTARLAAERANQEDIKELERLLDEMKEGDLDSYFEAELQFHLKLAASSQNEVLANLVKLLIERVYSEEAEFKRTTAASRTDTYFVFQEIIKAVKVADGERAAALVISHLGGVKRLLVDE